MRSPGPLKMAAQKATQAGALGHLWRAVLGAPALLRGPASLRVAAAGLVHRYAAALLGSADGAEVLAALIQRSVAESKAEFGPEASLVLASRAGTVVSKGGETAVPGTSGREV